MNSTQDILERHLASFAQGNLERILSDYAPDAVMFTQKGILTGPEAMRPLFQGLIAEFAKPGSVFTMESHFVAGDYAYIFWTAETADNRYEMATDTFTVRDGKIQAQSFTARVEPKH